MKKLTKKLLSAALVLVMVCSLAAVPVFAEDGEVTLYAKDAEITGTDINGTTPTAYNPETDRITGFYASSTITYTVPEGVFGAQNIYLEVGRAGFLAFGCTPFYVSINGDARTTPVIHYAAASAPGDEFGLFVLRSNVELKAGDKITVIGQLGLGFGTFMSLMPTVRNVKLYPAGTEVALGYNKEIPVKEEVDPSDPLSGLDIIWLGSSVTYGQQGGGYSMADYLAEVHPASNAYKFAISGTTLVDESTSSYVDRMKYIDPNIDADFFIVQLSTNDATNNKPLGELSDSFDRETFDTRTIYGAMEYIISYARETWGCPVLFYSGSYYESEAYGKMVQAMLDVQEKWGIDLIDLYNIQEMTDMYGTDEYNALMADEIHPNKTGYVEWWGPYFEEALTDVILRDQQHIEIDTVTGGKGDVLTTNISIKNNDAGISSYRLLLKTEADLNISVDSDYPIEWNKTADGYKMIVYTEDGSLITGDAVLFTVTIDLTDTELADGKYALDLSHIDSTVEDALQQASPLAKDGFLIIDNDYPLGDVNKDFNVDNADLIMIARYLVDLVKFDSKQRTLADYDQNGEINNIDLVKIAKALVGE